MGEREEKRETTAIVCRLEEEWARLFRHVAEELAALSTSGQVAPGAPHISLQVVEGRLSQAAVDALRASLKKQEPLDVYFRGVGRFYFPRPVIYVTVVRNRSLERLHRRVRRALRPFGLQADRLYGRRQWVPHLSLVLDDVGDAITPRLRDFEKKGAFRGVARVEALEILGPAGEREVLWLAAEER